MSDVGLSLARLPYGQKILELEPSGFSSLNNIFKILKKIENSRSVHIHDSVLRASFHYGRCELAANLETLLEKGVNMALTVDSTKVFTALKGNDDVAVYLDTERNLYTFTNGYTTAEVRGCTPAQFSTIPPITGSLGDAICLSDLAHYRQILDGSNYTDILVSDGQAYGISYPPGRKLSFSSSDYAMLQTEEPEMTLRSYQFLKVPGRAASIEIYKVEDQFRLRTTTRVDLKTEIVLDELLRAI